ncbi:MAG: pseudouridine synthase [Acidipropionibacterium sp.]|nr:pseudouridine synthase [Acidipropionibacterium sp.]
MRDFLVWKLPRIGASRVDGMLAEGRFVGCDGTAMDGTTPFTAQTFVYFHRDLPVETPVPFPIGILYRDDRILVADKPSFLSSIPRGAHVLESVVVKLRTQLGMPELTVAHRLDRVTSGVLLLTCRRQWRRPYQELFEHHAVHKTYRAVAPVLDLPEGGIEVASHIVKRKGQLQAVEVPGAVPNARTRIRLLERRGDLGLYEANPLTGKTHQIRLHFNRLGAPILNDPFYPEVLDIAVDDFTRPLQLQAHEMSFIDPVTGEPRCFRSRQELTCWR